MSKLWVRGVQYNVRIEGSGPPLLLLHGFTGSLGTWHRVLDAFTPYFTTVRVDLLGHGRSDAPHDPGRYALTESATDLHTLIDDLGFDRFHLLGYSLGGRVALHVALAQPHRIEKLVLESASLGIADASERQARLQADNELANFIETMGIEAFVDRWENVPLFATERNLPEKARVALRTERLANRPHGLANSLRGAGAGTQAYLQDEVQHLQVPTLVLAGALDPKYCAVAELTGRIIPNSQVAVVPNAGHAVHREQPDHFTRLVVDFLRPHETGNTFSYHG